MPRDGDGQTLSERIQTLCAQLSADLNSGQPARIENMLDGWQGDERSQLLRQLLGVEINLRRTRQEDLSVNEFIDRFPNDAALVNIVFEQSEATIGATQISAGTTAPQDFGEYTVLDKIGEGGMGAVYKARHKRMDRVVAIKLLPPKALDSPDAVKRFEREVKAAAKLEHPNVVTAYDAGEANGHHFLVMRYVEGQDLSAHVKQHGPLAVATAINYIAQTASGLEYAHDEGIIHRDIKPSNLLLNRKGTVKILDLGLARLDSETDDNPATELTQSGTAMGTVDYMAPEQSADAHTADVRSDIYSLGCTLYYLLTGKSVYGGATLFNRMLAHRDKPIPELTEIRPDTPAAVNDLFRKMVAKEPADRYQTMPEVIEALHACDIGELPESGSSASAASFPTKQSSPPTVHGLAPTATHVQPDAGESSPSETSISAINQQTVVATSEPSIIGKQSNNKYLIAATLGTASVLVIALLVWFNRPVETTDDAKDLGNVIQPAEDPPIKAIAAAVEQDFALEFDGKNDFVNISSLRIPETRPITVEMLVLPRPQRGTQRLLMSTGAKAFWVSQIGNQLEPGVGFASNRTFLATTFVSQPEFQPTTATHVAVVFQEDRFSLYIDGRMAGISENNSHTDSFSVPSNYTTRLLIGADPILNERLDRFFCGQIDEVRISNTARYTKVFTPEKRFDPDEHTLALYHFDEGQGNVLIDSSGNNHHGKIVGAKWVRADGTLIGRNPDHDIPSAAAANTLPGIIPQPKQLPGIKRWQVISKSPVGGNAVWSPDGKWIAITDGKRIRIHDGDSYQLNRVLAGHQQRIPYWKPNTLKWSPDGKWLASGTIGSRTRPPEIRLWNVADDRYGPEIEAGTIDVTAIAWSRDGKTLASATYHGDPFLRVWSLNGKLVQSIPFGFTQHYNQANSLEWISDGKQLAATGSPATNIAFVDVAKEQTQISSIKAGHYFSYSPNAKLIAMPAVNEAGTDSKEKYYIEVVNAETKEVIASMGKGLRHSAYNVVWSPDGQLIAAPGQNAHVWVFDWQSQKLQWECYPIHPVHNASWNPTGELLVTADSGGNTKIWEVGGNARAAHHVISGLGNLQPAAFARSPKHGSVAFVPTRNSELQIVNDNGQPQTAPETGDQKIQSVTWHPIDNRLATGDEKGGIRFWNLNGELEKSLAGDTGPVLTVAWSADGKMFAASSPDKLRLWNKKGDLQTSVETPSGISLLQWHPNSKLLAGAGFSKEVFIWDAQGELKQTLEGHGARVRSLTWRPDGSRLATAGEDGTVRQWSVDDQDVLSELDQLIKKPGDIHVYAVAWSPDGERLATSGNERELKLWSADGVLQQVIDVNSFDVPVSLLQIDWTSDNNRLITASASGRIHVWDLAQGQPIRASAILPNGHVATFDANGQMLFATEGAEQELIYLIEREEDRSLDVLTQEEFLEATKPK